MTRGGQVESVERVALARELATAARATLAIALLAGVFAGGLLYTIETVDRLWTLHASFVTGSEPIVYALYLAPTILMGAAAGLVAGVVVALAGAVARVASRLLERVVPRHARATGAVAAAVAIGLAVRLVSLAAPRLVEEPLLGLVKKVDSRVYELPWLVDHFGALLVVGLVVSAGALVAADLGLTARLAGWRRLAALVAAAALAGLLVAVYAVDSRIFYGRYELSMHLPAFGGMLAIAVAAAGLALVALGATRLQRPISVGAVALVALATLASGFAVWHLGANQNLKALLWRRSIVARRAYQAIAFASDRDRDGASWLLEGGDPDDHDPAVNPMAVEVPDNGVDDNGIGGDLTSTRLAPVAVASTAAAQPTPAGTARNLLLVSIDTLRADRMALYGYGRPTSPGLGAWAERGTVFERAYSQGSNTGISFASMQRSATRASVFDDERPTMFGRLSSAGFRTAFINARRDDRWLETKRWTRYRRVILDGVQSIDHTAGEQLWDADAVTDRAIAYLTALPAGERHATWVHYLDPHEPRRKMAPYDFGDTASDKYDSEVAFVDREVGRLLDWLRDSGRLADTIVVLVSDHGESFLDHGMDLHGNRPYNEQIHVPLMMWAPDVAPARVATPVGVLDIAPSVLSYLGLEPLPSAEGRDVLRQAVVERPLVAETPINLVEVSFHAFAVTDGGWRYIWDVRGNTVELYDLEADPHELKNLVDLRPDKAAELRAVMAAWLDTTRPARRGEGN